MQPHKTRTLAFFLTVILFSHICFAQTPDCGIEIRDEAKGMHAVIENCRNIGTFSLGGIYNGSWEKLTYFYPKPWAGTFITIKVDGKNYVNSHQSAEGIQMDQYIYEMPAAYANKLSVKWMLPEEILVEESIELIENLSLIHLTITNKDNRAHSVGARIHLDTMLGDNDGAPIYIPGDGLKEGEKEYVGARNLNYKYWKAYNRLDKPTIVATGMLDNENKLTYPDRLLIADWKKSVKTAWNYETEETRSILGDSAVILYYEPKEIRSGETREILTGYGSSEPVLKKITEITEIILSNITGEYCMGEEAGIKVDVGSRIDFSGSIRLIIKNSGGEKVYEKTAEITKLPAETVRSAEFIYQIPLDVGDDENYTITAKLMNAEGRQIDEKQTVFNVNARRCGLMEKDAGPNWLLIALILIILLIILVFIATRKKGEVIVKKTKIGNKVVVSVYNATEEPLKNGVIEDRIPEGAEVDMLTLHVKRKGTHLRLETGTLHPGQRVTLEYKIKGVNVVPKAVYKWDGGEKHSL